MLLHVLKKIGGITMINAQLKSGISGTYMHVCHTSMTHKLPVQNIYDTGTMTFEF